MQARLKSGGNAATAYVVADIVRTDDRYELQEVHAEVGGRRLAAVGDAACVQLLAWVVAQAPVRWFLPQALDVLAAMTDHGLTLPRTAIDPGIVAFVLNPAAPALSSLVADLALPASMLRWLGDTERSARRLQPLAPALDVLEELDAALRGVVAAAQMATLVEQDVGRTLPVLARMERIGAWVDKPQGFADWAALFASTAKTLIALEGAAAPLTRYGMDMYTTNVGHIVLVLKNMLKKRLPASHWSSDLTGQQQLERYVVLGNPIAQAVKEARSLVSPSGSYFWLKEMARAPTQLRGVSVPQLKGRWGMKELPLQNIPKRSSVGRAIRSGLVAPPGHVLVGADQNAFEVRLLADLSGDPALLKAASDADMHAALADHLFADRRQRTLAKLGMYAVLYGQTEDQFRCARSELSQPEAIALYRKIDVAFPTVFTHRDSILADYRRGVDIRTRGGWPLRVNPKARSEEAKERSIFNGTVQGLAADIQRWVLRELDAALRPFNARLVHQAHDEIFVAVADGPDVNTVRDLLVDTMTTQVMFRSGLLKHPVALVATPRVGRTWRDMI